MDFDEDYFSALDVVYDGEFEQLVQIRKGQTGCIKSSPLTGDYYHKFGCKEAIMGETWVCPKGETHEAHLDQESGERVYYNKTKHYWQPLKLENSVRFIMET